MNPIAASLQDDLPEQQGIASASTRPDTCVDQTLGRKRDKTRVTLNRDSSPRISQFGTNASDRRSLLSGECGCHQPSAENANVSCERRKLREPRDQVRHNKWAPGAVPVEQKEDGKYQGVVSKR